MPLRFCIETRKAKDSARGHEASGHARWFERLLAELKIELRIARRGQDSSEASL